MRLWPLPPDPVARPPLHGGRALPGADQAWRTHQDGPTRCEDAGALFRAGELQGVWVPDADHEAVRELVRARQTAMQEVRRSRQLLLSFLLRHDRAMPTRHHWTRAHQSWLARQSFVHPAEQVVFEELIQRIEVAAARQDRLEDAIRKLLPAWSLAPVVAALQDLRGVAMLAAVTLVAEIGDFGRFASPRQLMAWLGLVPKEHSSGRKVARGNITKAGNARARAGCWSRAPGPIACRPAWA